MFILPNVLGVLLVTVACLGDHHEIVSGNEENLKCPGVCQEAGSCSASLTETDCSENLICCVDHLDKMAATEFADFELTTESLLDSNFVQEVSESGDLSGLGNQEVMFGTSTAEQFESAQSEDLSEDGRYQMVYSDDADAALTSSLPEEIINTVNEGNCPGACVTAELAESCNYVVRDSPACSGSICCITEEFVQEDDPYEYLQDSSEIVKRSTHSRENGFNCPGTCVHPMHSVQCQNVLTQYSCPLNTRCCILANAKPAVEPIECMGMCIPAHMVGYCVPPNELLRAPSSCPPGQSCCSRNPSNGQPPKFANAPFQSQRPDEKLNEDILGHLAIDEMGTVFKVTNRGDVFPLQKIPPNANLLDFMKIGAYQRPEGELFIYSDKSGNLYQHLYTSQPIGKTGFAASGIPADFSSPDLIPEKSEVSDVVIPEDNDEPPVSTSKPVIHSDQNSRPSCPGSCMSYFLRFTCFRGFAIYDGFTCPSRSVCCARLEDIEEHEQYLKSLSPYFNVPPVSRDSNLPRCGIKGHRDTPRVMGGKDSLPGEWCWQVAVINLQNQYICGGALIDDSWVLTAAHCVVGPMEEAQALFIRAGVTDLKSAEDNSKGQTIKVLSTFVHHNFNSLNLDNNIALLRLQKPVTLGSNVCVVCLPTNLKMPKEDSKCTVTGYGFISPDGGMSLSIREAQVPIIDDMDCMTNVTDVLDTPFLLPASSFCAGGQGLKDACQGDAGGALACEIEGFHELIGLVSWGVGCGRDHVPSVYVKVPAFMGWINQIISSSSFFIP